MAYSLATATLIAAAALWAAPAAASPDLDACQSGKPAISIPACTRLIDAGTEPPDMVRELRTVRAMAYFNSGDFRRAIPDFDAGLPGVTDPAARRAALRLRAIAHYKVGDFDQSIEDYTASMAAPDAKGLVGRALAYLRQERYAMAFSDYNDALALQPGIPQALFGLGICEQERGNKAAAARDFAAARKIDPDIDKAFRADHIVPAR